MSKIIRHYELPVPSTESVTDATMHKYGKSVEIKFDYYRDGEPRRTALRFKGAVATMTRSERSCKSWHINSYDVLREIPNSPWFEEVRNDIEPRYRDEFRARHFVFYLDSVGSFEILADDFELMPEEAGSWQDLKKLLWFQDQRPV